MRVVFLGSADFGIPALKRLYTNHQICAVVSTPPKRKGRGLKHVNSPVTEYAQTHMKDIVCLMPERLDSDDLIKKLKSYSADCFVVVAFRLLPYSVFSIPTHGTINIHASLLPHYRGPAPIHRAIEAGEKVTGVSIFRIDEGIDTGEILLQERLYIDEQETTPDLYGRLSLLGADCLEKTLQKLEKSALTPITQNSTVASKAPKLRKEEALINWNLPSNVLFNRIRAFKPFPGTYTILSGKRLGIDWAAPVECQTAGTVDPGTITAVSEDSFDVQSGNGQLRILSVKPEGRKCMSVHDFLNGTTLEKGMKLN